MSLIDGECAGLARAFLRRTPRRPPASGRAGRDPMFKRTGSSFDLKNIREYGPSDDPRRIDWKLMGRTDRVYVKEFYEEERDGAIVLVDLSGSIAVFGEECAMRISASIAWILGALGLPYGLLAFNERVVRRMDRPRGGASPAPVTSFFQGLLASGPTDLRGALAAARKSSGFRRAVVVSDFLDPAFKPSSSPFARNFFIRLHRDIEDMDTGNSEVEVEDPETLRRIRLPWDALSRADYLERKRELDLSFGEAIGRGRPGGRTWYRCVEPDVDRPALYWQLLEALYA